MGTAPLELTTTYTQDSDGDNPMADRPISVDGVQAAAADFKDPETGFVSRVRLGDSTYKRA